MILNNYVKNITNIICIQFIYYLRQLIASADYITSIIIGVSSPHTQVSDDQSVVLIVHGRCIFNPISLEALLDD